MSGEEVVRWRCPTHQVMGLEDGDDKGSGGSVEKDRPKTVNEEKDEPGTYPSPAKRARREELQRQVEGVALKDIRCNKCRGPLRPAVLVLRCKDCRFCFHSATKCSGVPRAELTIDKDWTRDSWRCGACSDNSLRARQSTVQAAVKQSVKTARGTGLIARGKKGFKMLQWNADGINTKKVELEELMGRLDVDLAMIQESKLRSDQATPKFPGYTTLRKDRQLRRKAKEARGGGLLIFVKEQVPFREMEDWSGICTEGQRVVVHVSKHRKIVLNNVYRPPIRRTQLETRTQDPVRSWLRAAKDGIIAGDLNMHSTRWGTVVNRDKAAEEFEDWCAEEGYSIVNDGSVTHVDRHSGVGNAPDITTVSEELKDECSWKTLDELGSDHKPILITVNMERDERIVTRRLAWAWKRADWVKYRREVCRNLEADQKGTVKERVHTFNTAVMQAANVSIRKKKVSAYNKPYRSESLEKVATERNKCRSGGTVNTVTWKRKNKELEELVTEEKRKQWRMVVDELAEDGDSEKAWQTIKMLSSQKNSDRRNESLVVDGVELRSDNEKANSFGRMYAEINRLWHGKDDRKTRVEVNNRLKDYEKDEQYGKPFTRGELETAMRQTDGQKKGGDDGVEPCLLKELPEKGLEVLLEIYNESWKQGLVPGRWKKAIIIPLLKAGKDPKKRESFRHVSLTSAVVKLLERMVVNRLMYWIETNGVINKWQTGFQRGKSTEDQIIRLSQSIQHGFEKKPHHRTLGVAVDCSKAYDRVWRSRLIERMLDEGVPGPVIRWFKDFLEDRKAAVRMGFEKSKFRRMQEGLPQGAVSSPILFLLYVNEWAPYMVEGVECSGFADDVAFWVTGGSPDELADKAAAALKGIENWAKRNRVMLNPLKTEACLFTNNSKERKWNPKLLLDGKEVEMKKELKLLGVTVDQGLRFHGQLEAVISKMRKRSRVLMALAGKAWGWDRESMIRVYKTMVESVVWYGAAGWLPWITKTGFDRLEEAQRAALRVVAGLVKSTPSEAIYLETGVEPIRVEAKRRALTAFEKAMRLDQNNPLRELSEKRTRRRLKANKGWREQAKEISEKCLPGPRRALAVKRGCPWKAVDNCGAKLCDSLIEPVSKEDSEEKRKLVAQHTMDAHGKKKMEIYTDGSVAGGVENGGSAAVGRVDGEVLVRREAAGAECSSYEAEIRAMRMALEMVDDRKPGDAIIVTDSRALVKALQNGRCSTTASLEEVKSKLIEVAEGCNITIQWTPGHVGTEGNEEADREANEARNMEQGDVPIGYEAAKKRARREVKWKPELSGRLEEMYSLPIKRECLTRREAVLLAQLRSGQCASTGYWRHRMGLQETAKCPDCEMDEGKGHIFVCPKWEKVRESMGIEGEKCLRAESMAIGYVRRVKPKWLA